MKLDLSFEQNQQNINVPFAESGGKFNADFGETSVIHDGQNGATFIPSVSTDGVISWTNDRELPNPPPVNIKGAKGDKGEKGDKGDRGEQGTQGIQGIKGDKGDKGDTGNDGKDGKDGTNGKDGQDGFSPIVSVADIDGGHRVTITDKNGTQTFDVMDGQGGGGESVQADWNQNDPNAPEYVKNRTHYYIPEQVLITWDGDTNNRSVFSLDAFGFADAVLCKVSDNIYTEDELYKMCTRDIANDNSILSKADIMSLPGAVFYGEYGGIAILYSAQEFCNAFSIPEGWLEDGTYFLAYPNDGYYFCELYIPSQLEKLDEKYLPDTILTAHTAVDELGCELDNGWQSNEINWEENWEKVFPQSGTKNININITIFKKTNGFTTTCTFVVAPSSPSIASCFVEVATFGVVQVFIRLVKGLNRIDVAAKSFTI